MMSPFIPAVLQGKPGSISTERALKNIIECLEQHTIDNPTDQVTDQINSAIEDAKFMLRAVNRND